MGSLYLPFFPIIRFNVWISLGLFGLLLSCADTSLAPPQIEPGQAAPETLTTIKNAPSALLRLPRKAEPPPGPLPEAALWAELQRAGENNGQTYAVLLRHALAPGTGDPSNFQLEDCSTQRNLSEAGQRQASAMGENFRRRQVPIQAVLSSQWCRCLETAALMDVGPVTPFPPLNSFFRDRGRAEVQTAQVQQYLMEHQNQPGVVLMVTHQVNITALTGVVPSSGSAVVVQLGDDNQIIQRGQLSAPPG